MRSLIHTKVRLSNVTGLHVTIYTILTTEKNRILLNPPNNLVEIYIPNLECYFQNKELLQLLLKAIVAIIIVTIGYIHITHVNCNNNCNTCWQQYRNFWKSLGTHIPSYETL